MNRRSFLSLLVAAPFVPALAKLEHVLTPLPTLTIPNVGRVSRYMCAFQADAGFEPLIEAGRIARFVASPAIWFRPDRILFGHSAGSFELLNVSAEGEPQLDESLPGDFFSAEAFGMPRLQFHPVEPRGEVVLAVRNVGKEAAPFVAMMLGQGWEQRDEGA